MMMNKNSSSSSSNNGTVRYGFDTSDKMININQVHYCLWAGEGGTCEKMTV